MAASRMQVPPRAQGTYASRASKRQWRRLSSWEMSVARGPPSGRAAAPAADGGVDDVSWQSSCLANLDIGAQNADATESRYNHAVGHGRERGARLGEAPDGLGRLAAPQRPTPTEGPPAGRKPAPAALTDYNRRTAEVRGAPDAAPSGAYPPQVEPGAQHRGRRPCGGCWLNPPRLLRAGRCGADNRPRSRYSRFKPTAGCDVLDPGRLQRQLAGRRQHRSRRRS